ncbi:hypothetical protein B0H11DRAFT_2215222 [Mycena galericulata]|nr:hypothetical protein B0H11DRAFT_2215222 [Mycena galericulata]
MTDAFVPSIVPDPAISCVRGPDGEGVSHRGRRGLLACVSPIYPPFYTSSLPLVPAAVPMTPPPSVLHHIRTRSPDLILIFALCHCARPSHPFLHHRCRSDPHSSPPAFLPFSPAPPFFLRIPPFFLLFSPAESIVIKLTGFPSHSRYVHHQRQQHLQHRRRRPRPRLFSAVHPIRGGVIAPMAFKVILLSRLGGFFFQIASTPKGASTPTPCCGTHKSLPD